MAAISKTPSGSTREPAASPRSTAYNSARKASRTLQGTMANGWLMGHKMLVAKLVNSLLSKEILARTDENSSLPFRCSEFDPHLFRTLQGRRRPNHPRSIHAAQ